MMHHRPYSDLCDTCVRVCSCVCVCSRAPHTTIKKRTGEGDYTVERFAAADERARLHTGATKKYVQGNAKG
jgi:hypothetical protein